MLEKLMNPQEYSDEDVLAALKYVSGKTLQKTPVLNQERGASLFANAWRNGTATVFDNGMNLFKWIFVMFQKPIFRPYESKGALDRYAEDEKKQE